MRRLRHAPHARHESRRCGRCGRLIDRSDEFEWQETFTIRYESVDPHSPYPGPIMEADFCQHCMLVMIGPWLRVTQEYATMPKRRPGPRPRWAYQQFQIAEAWPRRHDPDDEA